MKMKAVLKSLLIAYGITGVFLLFLALALFSFDVSEKAVRAGILAAYILACLTGGYGAGKMLRKEKYLWGLLVGSCYFFLLLMVSVLAGGKPDMTMKHMITTFFLCLGGGTLGGMLS